MNYKPLNDAINNATKQFWTYPSTFEQLREPLKEKYGAKWIGKLTTEITGVKPASESGFKRGTEGYAEAQRNFKNESRKVERWEKFYTDPTNSNARNPNRTTAAFKAKFEEIGKTLEPLKKDAPPSGLTFEITFRAPADKAHAPRERTTAGIHLDHATAVQYINQDQPQYDFLFDEWFPDGGDQYGEDGDYEVDVTAVSVA